MANSRPPAKVLASKDPDVLRKIASAKAAKSSNGSVKIVAKTSDQARATANLRESIRLHNTQFTGNRIAHAEKFVASQPKPKPVKVNSNPVRTSPGISGKGGSNVGGLYRPMGGGGMNWSTK